MNERVLNALGLLRKEASDPVTRKLAGFGNKYLRRGGMWLYNKLMGIRPAKGLSTPKTSTHPSKAVEAFKINPIAPKNMTFDPNYMPDASWKFGDKIYRQDPSYVSDRDIVLGAAINSRDAARVSRKAEADAMTFPPLKEILHRVPLKGTSGDIYFDKSGKGVTPKYSDVVGREYEITSDVPFETIVRSTRDSDTYNPQLSNMIYRLGSLLTTDKMARNASELLQRVKYNKLGIVPGRHK